ncbi:MAG TPA: protein kinase family protein [Pseudonocardiaceae bacterium]|nr:protein kinase family protein [Pseudonocardiaceae bacterium]
MRLAPDEVLGDGRYLLLAACGADERAGMEFWHARDLGRGRDVALTVLLGDPSDQVAVRSARHVLEGVRYAEAITHPALARVLDLPPGRVAAARDGVLGFVVAEWIEGVDLVDGVYGAHLPIITACRMLRPLVDAVDVGHHSGVVAGIDSPGRLRIGGHGAAALGFRGTPPITTTRDDVGALGAVLYLLLTGVWPMADAEGRLVDPTALRPEVPRDLALVAVLSLDSTQGPGIRTCGPLLRALDEMIAYEVYEEQRPAPVPEPVRVAAPRRRLRTMFRGRRLAAALGTLAVAVAVLIGTQVAGAFGAADTTSAESVLPPPVTKTTPPVTTTTTTPPAPPPSITPATVREYVVSGNEDNPRTLSRVIDGDPGTMWHTDTYRQQFPVYTPGIGIVAGFAQPVAVAAVTIQSPSAGTVVQIRAAPTADVSLDSPVLATATLTDGATTIPLPVHAASPYLLVWITHLDDADGGFQSRIAEITCQLAAA